MKNWCLLCRDTLFAEFPSFSIVMAFSVFKLPKERRPRPQSLTQSQRTHLGRLAQCFKQPRLVPEYEDHVRYATAAYSDASFRITYWDAWIAAIKKTESMRSTISHPSAALKYTVHRGRCWLPVTSSIEQSFSQVATRLGDRRLNASSDQEARYIGLLAANYTEPEVRQLAADSQRLWQAAFPDKHNRAHKQQRTDLGMLRGNYKRKANDKTQTVSDTAGVLTETQWRKMLKSSIANLATSGDAAHLDTYTSTTWTERHAAESQFQKDKAFARLVEAMTKKNAGASPSMMT